MQSISAQEGGGRQTVVTVSHSHDKNIKKR